MSSGQAVSAALLRLPQIFLFFYALVHFKAKLCKMTVCVCSFSGLRNKPGGTRDTFNTSLRRFIYMTSNNICISFIVNKYL